jgi:hypothetical protein
VSTRAYRLTVAQAAVNLGVSYWTLYHLKESGQLSLSFDEGGHSFLTPADMRRARRILDARRAREFLRPNSSR